MTAQDAQNIVDALEDDNTDDLVEQMIAAFPNAIIFRIHAMPTRAKAIKKGECYLLDGEEGAVANQFFRVPVYVTKAVNDIIAAGAAHGDLTTSLYYDLFAMLHWTGRKVSNSARSVTVTIWGATPPVQTFIVQVNPAELDDPTLVIDVMTLAEWEEINEECTPSD